VIEGQERIPPFRLHLAGPVRLEALDATGRFVTVRLGSRTLALLAVLGVADGQGEWRDRLARLIWERVGIQQAQDSLRQALLEIARKAGPIIRKEGRLLRLDPDACAIHPSRMGDSAQEPVRPSRLLDLPFLGPKFEAWVLEARQMLADRAGSPQTRVAPASAAPPGTLHPPAAPLPADDPWVSFRPSATSGPRLLLPAPSPSAPDAERRLAHVVRDELADVFARFRDLHVILDPRAIDAIGLETHPACMALDLAVAEGKSGAELRDRLLEWPSRSLLWNDRRPIKSADPLAALAALAERTAMELLPELERHALAAASPLSGEAWRRYLACREQILFLKDHEAARAVATELEALVTTHPSFLAARPPLIRLYNTDYFDTRAGTSGPAERTRAFELARGMDRRDPLPGHGWIVLGWGHLWRAEWRQAEDALERAVELNPHHPQRLCGAAFGLLHLGRLDRCEALMAEARRIAGHPDAMWWGDFGILRFVEGDLLEAHAALGRGLPSFIWTPAFRLAAAVEAGLDPRHDAETLGRAACAHVRRPASGPPHADALAFDLLPAVPDRRGSGPPARRDRGRLGPSVKFP